VVGTMTNVKSVSMDLCAYLEPELLCVSSCCNISLDQAERAVGGDTNTASLRAPPTLICSTFSDSTPFWTGVLIVAVSCLLQRRAAEDLPSAFSRRAGLSVCDSGGIVKVISHFETARIL